MSGDYIMRQINDIARIIGTMIFLRKVDAFEIYDEEGNVTQSGTLRLNLRALVRQGKINEAENALFATIEDDPREEYLPCALDFYRQLNEMGDDALAAANFSRQEIAEGLCAVRRLLQRLPGYDDAYTELKGSDEG